MIWFPSILLHTRAQWHTLFALQRIYKDWESRSIQRAQGIICWGKLLRENRESRKQHRALMPLLTREYY